MKLRKFIAKDTKEALNLVKREMGADALIIHTRQVKEGVEIVASDQMEVGEVSANGMVIDQETDKEIRQIQGELNSLKGLVAEQMSSIIWDYKVKPTPNRATAIRRLISQGFHNSLIDEIIKQLPDPLDPNQVNNYLIEIITKGLSVMPQKQGVKVFWGLSGCGKTSIVSKVASIVTMQSGKDNIALIICDTQRIGHEQQLYTFAEILDIPIRKVENKYEMQQALQDFRYKQHVLIDTQSISLISDDAQYKMFPQCVEYTNYLVLPANVQYEVALLLFDKYSNVKFSGTIATKLDETFQLGPFISFLITKNLPLAFISSGSNIPDDISIPDVKRLVNMAFDPKLINMSDLTDQDIARIYTKVQINESNS